MGVLGLWDILLTIAQSCAIDKLSGKILAIDASIWIVKTASLFEEDNEKIKCILDKIVLLKRHNILPVFVFDGVAPMIKRKTL
jgi:DNA excision repair protein ERCC-5